MNLGWQDALVGLAVLGAAAWLVRRRLAARKGCSDCALAEVVARGGPERAADAADRAKKAGAA